MSRFPGWTTQAVMKLSEVPDRVKIKKKVKLKTNKNYSAQISNALRALGIKCECEYRFIKDRRFRFDVAIPEHKIAIEFEGGVYKDSRHTKPVGYIQDTKKYNLATMHGWKLLRYTTEVTKDLNWDFKIALEVESLIKSK